MSAIRKKSDWNLFFGGGGGGGGRVAVDVANTACPLSLLKCLFILEMKQTKSK